MRFPLSLWLRNQSHKYTFSSCKLLTVSFQALRLFNFLDVIQYFTFYKRKQDCKTISLRVTYLWLEPVAILKLIRSVLDFISSVSDNWVFLGRVIAIFSLLTLQIEVYKWKNSAESNLVNYLGTFASIAVLIIDTINELLVMFLKSKTDSKLKMNDLMWNKKLWFLQKVFDFPVRINN